MENKKRETLSKIFLFLYFIICSVAIRLIQNELERTSFELNEQQFHAELAQIENMRHEYHTILSNLLYRTGLTEESKDMFNFHIEHSKKSTEFLRKELYLIYLTTTNTFPSKELEIKWSSLCSEELAKEMDELGKNCNSTDFSRKVDKKLPILRSATNFLYLIAFLLFTIGTLLKKNILKYPFSAIALLISMIFFIAWIPLRENKSNKLYSSLLERQFFTTRAELDSISIRYNFDIYKFLSIHKFKEKRDLQYLKKSSLMNLRFGLLSRLRMLYFTNNRILLSNDSELVKKWERMTVVELVSEEGRIMNEKTEFNNKIQSDWENLLGIKTILIYIFATILYTIGMFDIIKIRIKMGKQGASEKT